MKVDIVNQQTSFQEQYAKIEIKRITDHNINKHFLKVLLIIFFS